MRPRRRGSSERLGDRRSCGDGARADLDRLGFWAFLLVTLAMLVGAVVGRIVDGRLDVRALADVVRGRRSSS